MEKYFICTDEPNPKDDKKKFYHRIGELLKFETQAGGTFYKVKLYLVPEKQLSVFKDEPRKETGGAKAGSAPDSSSSDLPF